MCIFLIPRQPWNVGLLYYFLDKQPKVAKKPEWQQSWVTAGKKAQHGCLSGRSSLVTRKQTQLLKTNLRLWRLILKKRTESFSRSFLSFVFSFSGCLCMSVWRSESNLWQLVLSFHLVILGSSGLAVRNFTYWAILLDPGIDFLCHGPFMGWWSLWTHTLSQNKALHVCNKVLCRTRHVVQW